MLDRLFSRYWLLLPLLLLVSIEETVDMRQSEADYYLESFTTRKFDQAGRLEYVLLGETLTHFPDDDRAEIVEPEVTLHQSEQIWNISADRGKFVQEAEVFTLSGGVDIIRTPTAKSGAKGDKLAESSEQVRLRTEEVTLYLKSNEVKTDKPISIVAETWQLDAVGLQSSIDSGKLTLLSNVSGHFDVAKPE